MSRSKNPSPTSPHIPSDLPMFEFMMTFGLFTMMVEALGCGIFPKCRAKLDYGLVVGHLCWEHPNSCALPDKWHWGFPMDDGMLITVVLVHKGLSFQHGFSNPLIKRSLWVLDSQFCSWANCLFLQRNKGVSDIWELLSCKDFEQ